MNVNLTPEMRAWLGSQEVGDRLLYDFVRAFILHFGLTQQQAAKLMSKWISETL